MSPLLALALGAFLPNYIIVVAAAGQVLQLPYSDAVLIALSVAFLLIASVGVAAPLGVRLFRPRRSAIIYASWRTWLIEHSRQVSYGTGAVVAVVLVAKGVLGLFSG